MKHDTKNLPDEELARLAAAGDPTAFCEIHNRHRGRVYSIALRMTGNAADAEDLTQESFLRLFLRIGSFRGESAFTTWLYRLVVNEVKMHFRYRSKRPEVQTSDSEMPERDMRFVRHAYSRQVIDRLAIEKAVQSLPLGYRMAFVQHDFEGYKHKESAQLLGYSDGTSKSQLHRARVRLRELLSEGTPALHI
jgi:RNA polymerase sigma-70 factor (ECF subfamily)